jgi:hypothetical protein
VEAAEEKEEKEVEYLPDSKPFPTLSSAPSLHLGRRYSARLPHCRTIPVRLWVRRAIPGQRWASNGTTTSCTRIRWEGGAHPSRNSLQT